MTREHPYGFLSLLTHSPVPTLWLAHIQTSGKVNEFDSYILAKIRRTRELRLGAEYRQQQLVQDHSSAEDLNLSLVLVRRSSSRRQDWDRTSPHQRWE